MSTPGPITTNRMITDYIRQHARTAFWWGFLIGAAIGAILAALLTATIATAAPPPHTATLTWTPSPDATGNPSLTYNAYRAPGTCPPTAPFTQQATAIAATTWVDTNPILGTSCYQVTALLNGAESNPSNQAQAVILPSPPPTLTIAAK